MAEELQSLLDKIYEQGVSKAENERDRILAAARAEAEQIVSAARAEAEETTRRAKAEADSLQQRAESAIAQAGRDVVLKLKSELEARILRAVGGAAARAMTPEFMAQLVREIAAKFAGDPDAELNIMAAVRDVPALDAALRSALADSFKNAPALFGDPEISGGLEVSFRGDQLYFDFTLSALTALVGEYVGPRLAALLEEK